MGGWAGQKRSTENSSKDCSLFFSCMTASGQGAADVLESTGRAQFAIKEFAARSFLRRCSETVKLDRF